MNRTAIITGSRGQDASYLAELLLEKGYTVIGIDRRSSSSDYTNIKHLLNNPKYIVEQGDITDSASISRIVQKYKPDEFYNLAAQSFVGASWDQAAATCDVNFTGVCNCLEAIRLFSSKTKFFQASTSEVYGDVITNMQNEETPARPRSPYAAAKYGAESLVKVYRDSYGIFACYARSFNHESPRRGKEFVTRKITNWIGNTFRIVEDILIATTPFNPANDSVLNSRTKFYPTQESFDAALKMDIIKPVHLGNLEARRDWSHAKDIVRGMWMMLQQDKPEDYVLASGKARSIREFLNSAFQVIGVDKWEQFVIIDPKFYRPADVALLCGDSNKAHSQLGWTPEISFDQLVSEMVKNDINL